MEAEDYKTFILAEFKRRVEKNSSYSQNAFARDLGISPSRLSEILRGKQGLSLRWAITIAENLHLSKEESEHFCNLVMSKHARSRMQREAAISKTGHGEGTTLLKLKAGKISETDLPEVLEKLSDAWSQIIEKYKGEATGKPVTLSLTANDLDKEEARHS